MGRRFKYWIYSLNVRASVLRSFAILCIAGYAACTQAAQAPIPISAFERGIDEWTLTQIDKKIPATIFRSKKIEGIYAVESVADKSMALLTRQIKIDLARTPILCWQWRVNRVIASADITQKKGDDQAARLYLGIDLPSAALSFATRAKLSMARRQGGDSVPDGALNYVWDNKQPVGTARANVYTDRARLIVLQSGNANAGQWMRERRNIAADIIAQFGVQGEIQTISLASDTDNTGETVTAGFADIHMVTQNAACQFRVAHDGPENGQK